MQTTLQTADGIALRLQSWPAPDIARGTVLIVHGLGEHIDRYAHVAARLNNAGWRVQGYDHRGHGRSGGARGALAEVNDLLRDLGRVIDVARTQDPGPLFLLGHSLGGLVAARFVAEGLAPAPAAWWRPVDGLALSSPALDPGLSTLQKLLLAVMGALAPDLPVHNGVRPSHVSRDAAVVAAYENDPLVHNRVTARLVRFIVDAANTVAQGAPRWRLPTLLMYAGSDRLLAPDGSRRFAAAAPAGVLTAREFPALYHEIFNEPEQDEVLGILAGWLEGRGAGFG